MNKSYNQNGYPVMSIRNQKKPVFLRKVIIWPTFMKQRKIRQTEEIQMSGCTPTKGH